MWHVHSKEIASWNKEIVNVEDTVFVQRFVVEHIWLPCAYMYHWRSVVVEKFPQQEHITVILIAVRLPVLPQRDAIPVRFRLVGIRLDLVKSEIDLFVAVEYP